MCSGAPAAAGPPVGVLLERAQEAGAVRRDIGLPEVYALLIGAPRNAPS